MKTRTKEEIISEVHKSISQHRSSSQRFRQLKSVLSKTDPTLVGDALLTYWRTLVDPDEYFEAQQFVASLLFALNPTCTFSLNSLLRELPYWNLSVEEYPWYLALQFGKDQILQELLNLVHTEPDDRAIARAAETVRYWLNFDFEAAQLNY